ncbi:MAG: dihydroorotate dehydrogenase (quinone) [Bdellovibrionales bacterium]|nr:dihydroorotate dehydrogenase (quinone) [Bdellovibrionales bacterium]
MKLKPWLLLPSPLLYSLHPFFLNIYSRIQSGKTYRWKTLDWRGLHFPNPLGTAGGVDKNACYVKNYCALGAGFLELGTVTPEAQAPNPRPLLKRSLKHFSLWNNMGFPNRGLHFFEKQLDMIFKENSSFPIPLFINLGKNRTTALSSAVLDYKKGMLSLWKYASAFVINISSPNTQSLRDIFDTKYLMKFLKSINEIRLSLNKNIPLILKLSPDEEDSMRIIEQSLTAGIDGWCLTNSTRQRPVKNLFLENKGGVSGKLLAPLSIHLLKELRKWLDKNKVKDKLVISCGGVLTPQDVFGRLDIGADLVQVYSALVFNGYSFFSSVYSKIKEKNS